MGRGLRIGRLFGIDIHIDWSWIFVFLLVTWSLAGGVFPAWHPEWSAAVNLAVAVTAALLFFASVLVHELSHSLVAKANGLPVRRITLFLFGGVSNIEREPPSPKIEFLMAVVGPLASILLGIFFTILGSVTAIGMDRVLADPEQVIAQSGPLSTLLLWLGPVNLIVGFFNLIPGFPLDGGRILRSLLWLLTGNLRRATRWAAAAGQVVGWLFIMAGIAMILGVQLPLLGQGVVSGLWLAFIGWFLNNAAVASYQQVVIRDLLGDVPVFQLMRSDVPTVSPDMPVSHLVYDWIMGTDERAFPVVEGERLVGLVCLEDVRKLPRDAWNDALVSEIMTRADQLETVNSREDAGEALEKLARRDVRQMPVIQDGRLVGLLRRRDILKWLQLQSEFGRAERGLLSQ